jgi:hypothetical protein
MLSLAFKKKKNMYTFWSNEDPSSTTEIYDPNRRVRDFVDRPEKMHSLIYEACFSLH